MSELTEAEDTACTIWQCATGGKDNDSWLWAALRLEGASIHANNTWRIEDTGVFNFLSLIALERWLEVMRQAVSLIEVA